MPCVGDTSRSRIFHQDVLETWHPAAEGPLPQPRFGHTAVVHGGDEESEMIVFGGRAANAVFDDVWSYSWRSKRWTLLCETRGMNPETNVETDLGRPQPSGRAGHTAMLSYTDEMVVFGGSSTSACLNDVWTFDLGERRWTSRSNPADVAPSGRRGHTARRDGTNMIVFGGSDGCGGGDDIVWTCDLTTWRWSSVACVGSPPSSRFYHVAEIDSVTHVMYVFGGRCTATAPAVFYNDLFSLRLSDRLWVRIDCLGPVPTHRMCSTSIFHRGVFCVFFGGASEYFADSYEFDPRTERWRMLLPGPSSRSRPTAVVQGNIVTVFGGCHHDRFLNDVMELRLAVPSLKECCRQWLRGHNLCSNLDNVSARCPPEHLPSRVTNFLQSAE